MYREVSTTNNSKWDTDMTLTCYWESRVSGLAIGFDTIAAYLDNYSLNLNLHYL